MTTALTTEVRDGIAVLTLDVPNAPVNTFSSSVREEFAAAIDRLEQDESVRAAVVRSGKPDVWVAGADIEEFLGIETSSQAEALSRDGHALLERLEKLRTPVVAAISIPSASTLNNATATGLPSRRIVAACTANSGQPASKKDDSAQEQAERK